MKAKHNWRNTWRLQARKQSRRSERQEEPHNNFRTSGEQLVVLSVSPTVNDRHQGTTMTTRSFHESVGGLPQLSNELRNWGVHLHMTTLISWDEYGKENLEIALVRSAR